VTRNFRVIARNICPILRHTLHDDLFFGYNFRVFAPNDLRFIGMVLMTIIHLASIFIIFKNIYYPKIDPNLMSHLPIWRFIEQNSTQRNKYLKFGRDGLLVDL